MSELLNNINDNQNNKIMEQNNIYNPVSSNELESNKERLLPDIDERISQNPCTTYYNEQVAYYQERISKFAPVQMPLFYQNIQNDKPVNN